MLDEEVEIVSKSQMKREMTALQNLGVALVALSKGHIDKLDLPDTLRTAILDAQRITANGAIKRQRQYIGRLMREVDPVPIQAYLDSLRGESNKQTAWLHQLERTRDELLSDDKAVAKFIDEHPEVEIQTLRQHVRNARAERAGDKPPKHYRALFQLLKDHFPEPSLIENHDDELDNEDILEDENE